jgi:Putative zinc-finger
MTASANHQHSDSAEQLEQLSAYLDDELDETERAALDEHLATCEECRGLLAELRETRSLLRALPAPTLSRSFLIPETGAIPQPLAGARRTTTATRTATQRRRGARVLQWVGGLVATLGLLLFVGTTLLSSGNLAIHSGSASSAAAARSTSPGLPPQPTSAQQFATSKPASSGGLPPQATATVVVPAPTKRLSTSSDKPTHSPAITGSTPPLGPIAGVLLLIGGAGLLLAGTVISRRRVLL